MQIDYTYVSDVTERAEADKIIFDLIEYSVFGIDTETTGLELYVAKPRLLQVAAIPPDFAELNDAKIYVFDLWRLSEGFLDSLFRVLNFFHVRDYNPPKKAHVKNGHVVKMLFGHNIKFDIAMLWSIKRDITGTGEGNVLYDTYLAEQLIRNAAGDKEVIEGQKRGFFGLKATVDRYDLGYSLDKTEQVSDWSAEVLTGQQKFYAALDAVAPYPLVVKQIEVLEQDKLKEAALLDFRALPAIAAMEYYGVKLDTEKWLGLIPEYEADVKKTEENLLSILPQVYRQKTWAGENNYSLALGSTSQLLVKLQEMEVPDPDEPDKLIQSTSKDNLLRVDVERFPWIGDIVVYRKATKAISSFLQPLPTKLNPVTQRLHTNLKQHGTITGRVSSYSPNLNQIPRDAKYRHCFVAEEGNVMVGADYSGLELRLLADIYREQVMLDAYREDINADLHRLSAAKFNHVPPEEVTKKQRTGGKCSNFLLAYAGGWKLLKLKGKTQYGFEMTVEEAQRNHKMYHETYKDVDAVHKRVFNAFRQAENQGRWTERIYPNPRTYSGRRLKLVDPKSPNQIINFPVQGGAGDLGKKALGDMFYALKKENFCPTRDERIKIVLYVYDEILLEVKEELAEKAAKTLQFFMEDAGNFYCKSIPGLILADPGIGKTWGDVH